MGKLSKQQLFKRIEKKCQICGEDKYELLDVHRIVPQSHYTEKGTVVLCVSCHRKCHTGLLEIIAKNYSTSGKYVITYIENGEEKLK